MIRIIQILLLLLGVSSLNTTSHAQSSGDGIGVGTLGLPVDCTINVDCSIHFYVDMQAGDAAKDYRCGPKSYATHRGTDFRVPSYKDLEKGIAILAAADGVVHEVRDGFPDVSSNLIGRDTVLDYGHGNRIIIRHRQGLLTVYAHLKRESMLVKKGDRVRKGQPIAQMGLSGLTSFPHLHFETLINLKPVDPFTGAEKDTDCNATGPALWDQETLASLAYQDVQLLRLGFHKTELNVSAMEYEFFPNQLRNVKTLYLQAYLIGLRKNDQLRFSLIGPDGSVMNQGNITLPEAKAWDNIKFKINPKENRFNAGLYQGRFELLRVENGETVTKISTQTKVTIE